MFLRWLIIASFAILASSPAAADDGHDFFGYSIGSTPEQVQAALGKTMKVSTADKPAGQELRGEFDSGYTEVSFAGDRIYKVFYTQGLLPEETIRRVDGYFVKKLGRPHSLKLKELESYFPEDKWAACSRDCVSSCSDKSSPFTCDEGRICHASCRSRLVPADNAALQDFLFEAVVHDGNEYSAYWPCTGRAGTPGGDDIFAAPPEACLLRLTVNYCRPGGGDKTYCQYTMLYLDRELEATVSGK